MISAFYFKVQGYGFILAEVEKWLVLGYKCAWAGLSLGF